MYRTIPVYYPSLKEADRKEERELWLQSYHINMDCKRAIEDRAITALHTHELDLLIQDLIKNYGVERTMYVLSRTVQFRKWDERFDKAVCGRAKAFPFPDADQQPGQTEDKTSDYITDIDPCILNHIYTELIKMDNQEISATGTDKEKDIGDWEVFDE